MPYQIMPDIRPNSPEVVNVSVGEEAGDGCVDGHELQVHLPLALPAGDLKYGTLEEKFIRQMA